VRTRSIFSALAALSLLAPSASAHHSFAMFDAKRFVTWKGKVLEYQWTNPHTHIMIEVPANSPDPTLAGKWDIEGASPNIMVRQGWKKATFKPGDPITIVGHPMRDGSHGGSLYYAVGPDGQKLYHDVNRSGGPAG
jgi:hypothetical protein